MLADLYRLLAWKSAGGNQCYNFANDLDQANDNLELAKKLISVNPVLDDAVYVKQRLIERKEGKEFLEILPAGDVVGTHGKTYLFAGFDEIHGYKTLGHLGGHAAGSYEARRSHVDHFLRFDLSPPGRSVV